MIPKPTPCSKCEIEIKTHDSVSCGPRSRHFTPWYINRKKENIIFTPLYLGDPLSNWNQLCYRITTCQPGESLLNLKEIAPAISEIRPAKVSIFFLFLSFFVFSHTCKKCYKTQMRTPITLKFVTQKGSPKVNPSIKFGPNTMNCSGFMTNYSRKTRSICCHAYRVSRFME